MPVEAPSAPVQTISPSTATSNAIASTSDYPDPSAGGRMAREILSAHISKRYGDTAHAATPPPEKKPTLKVPKIKDPDATEKPTVTQGETETPTEGAKPEQEAPAAVKEGEGNPTETTTAPEAPTDDKGKKVSPWKLVETYKGKVKSLETEIAELKSRIAPESDFKALQEKYQALEKRYQEKEDKIRLKEYEQSDEYKEKYWAPYEQSYRRGLQLLSEITVTDPTTGTERQAKQADLDEVLSLNLGQARKLADEKFGAFANDVMTIRKDIIDHLRNAEGQIERMKKEGATLEKQQSEMRSQQEARIKQDIEQQWAKANEDYVAHEKYGVYFKPRENDPEWNKRLQKGTEFVDKAFATIRPQFQTREQMNEAIKLHAAIRNRAIAFSALRHEVETITTDRDAWKAKYEAIANSAPPAGQGQLKDKVKEGPRDYRSMIRAGLEKIAH